MTSPKASYPSPFRPFGDARRFARSLNLRSTAQWREYCKSGDKPKDIPTDPRKVYLNKGWVGFSDWLGKPEVNYEDLSKVPMTDTVRKGIDILISNSPDKYRKLEELLRPTDWDPRVGYPITFIATDLGLPYHRVKYELGKEYWRTYGNQRRNAIRQEKQPVKELEHEPLAFALQVPEEWKVQGWESAEDSEDYAEEAILNPEGKMILRRIGYTGLSAENVTSPCQIRRTLVITKYQLKQPMTALELWDICNPNRSPSEFEGFENRERHYRPGAPLKIAGMNAVRHIVFYPQYMDQKWVTRTYSVYMCNAYNGWSITMVCDFEGSREEIEDQHHIQRAVFFRQIAPSFRTQYWFSIYG